MKFCLSVLSPLDIKVTSTNLLVTRYDEITGQPYNKTVKETKTLYYYNCNPITEKVYYDYIEKFEKENLKTFGSYLLYDINIDYLNLNRVNKLFEEFKAILTKLKIDREPVLSYY